MSDFIRDLERSKEESYRRWQNAENEYAEWDDVKNEMKKETCDIHGIKAFFSIQSDGHQYYIQVKRCCCTAFLKQLQAEYPDYRILAVPPYTR